MEAFRDIPCQPGAHLLLHVLSGTGAFLALGQKLFGHPFWGVWLSTGLMCAAFCWALQGWVPPAWAFLAGILAIIRLGTFSYWADSYWGGSVPALGGALVLGALPRIVRHRRVRDSVVLAIGLAILGNSRPYESVFYATPILVALGLAIFRSTRRDRRQYWHRVVLPALVLVLLTLAGMGYYFKQCTGSALLSPYMVNVRTYETAPLFPWQNLSSQVIYRNTSMAVFEAGWSIQQYHQAREHPLFSLIVRLFQAGLFFGGPLPWLAWIAMLVVLPYGMSVRDLGPKTVLFIQIVFLTIIGMSLPVYFNNHY